MGSTSGKWVFFETPNDTVEFVTPGLSPIHSTEMMAMDLLRDLHDLLPNEPASIHFFGTGCYHAEPRSTMYHWLATIFTSAQVRVRSDLESAALATLGKEDGWIAILGTGSSLARWRDGKLTLSPTIPGENGDPGSGTAIGNMLLQSYFYSDLPIDLRESLTRDHPEIGRLEPGQIQSQHPDKTIARYAQWVIEHATHHPYLAGMVKKALNEFIEKRIIPCYDLSGGAVHFNGSVAWHARSWLQELLNERGISIGKIVVSPMEGLIAFYKEEMKYGKGH